MRVMVNPEVVQTASVDDDTETVKPLSEVGATVNGDTPYVFVAIDPNVIVCEAFEIEIVTASAADATK